MDFKINVDGDEISVDCFRAGYTGYNNEFDPGYMYLTIEPTQRGEHGLSSKLTIEDAEKIIEFLKMGIEIAKEN